MINFVALIFVIISVLYGRNSIALSINSGENNGERAVREVVNVGVILDLESGVGGLARDYIALGLSDFYAGNANYQTRLALSVMDSKNSVVAAASAALKLIKEEDVHAIIGPQKSSQAKFVINLGETAKVPVISFSATSPSLSPSHNPFFVRTAQDDSSQVKAIASLVKRHGWHRVALIHEDTEYGNGLIPYLVDAFQEIDAQLSYRSSISPSMSGFRTKIAKELAKIMARETRVVLVHMTATLGHELFRQATEIGMMSEGFVWIATDGLSNSLESGGSYALRSMQGVLSVRPYLLKSSKRLEDLKVRLNLAYNHSEINMFGLWAYDTVWALARAAESAARTSTSRRGFSRKIDEAGFLGLKVSKSGPLLLKSLERSNFEGLSGEFRLKGRQLVPTAFEITNVVGKEEKVVGYWDSDRGIIRSLYNDLHEANSHTSLSEYELKPIIWPGSTQVPPRGWVIPIVGQKLQIGVPVTNGFREFFKVEWDRTTDEPRFSGYSYEVFMAALDKMPFAVPFKLVPFANSSRKMAGTYDELLYQIKLGNFDAVVGDTTITANRTSFVDFSLSYSDSGISMVVKIRDDERKNIWIFLKPLSWDLWLTTGCAFVFTGFVVWIFEHRTNGEFRGPPNQQLGIIFWFSFSTLVFAHRERLVNNWSRFVLIIWIFVVLILTQSYTASLASMLTVNILQPSVVDVNELKRNGDFVGYQGNSFVREFLTEELNFDMSKLRAYSNPDEYADALSRGSKNGGVGAIFDEIPYIRLFLAKYCSKYTMVGPTFKSDGFGFAFPLGSPLVPYISRAILQVTEDHSRMREFERKYFGDSANCEDQVSSNGVSLSVQSFGGLFIITGLASALSCFMYLLKFYRENWTLVSDVQRESSVWSRLMSMAKQFDNRDVQSQHLQNGTERNTPESSPAPD